VLEESAATIFYRRGDHFTDEGVGEAVEIVNREGHHGVPLLLMQVGPFGSLRTHYTSRQDGSSLLELVEHLCISYPADHDTFLVRSTGNERHEADVHPISLTNLCKVTAEQLGGASLYVPALTDLQPDPDIISRMSKL
jgi:hypothetical protein